MLLRLRRGSFASLLLVGVTAGACDSPTAPTAPVGVFVLQSVEGQPLPAVMSESETVRTLLVADTLVFTAPGVGQRVRIVRTELLDGSAPPQQARQEGAVSVRRVDGTLVVSDDDFCRTDPSDADCALQPLALEGNDLQVGPRRYLRVIDTP